MINIKKKKDIRKNMPQHQCNHCKRRFKTLTDNNLCYYCYINKYGTIPTTGQYYNEKKSNKT